MGHFGGHIGPTYDVDQHGIRTLRTHYLNIIPYMKMVHATSLLHIWTDHTEISCPMCPNVDQHGILDVQKCPRKCPRTGGRHEPR